MLWSIKFNMSHKSTKRSMLSIFHKKRLLKELNTRLFRNRLSINQPLNNKLSRLFNKLLLRKYQSNTHMSRLCNNQSNIHMSNNQSSNINMFNNNSQPHTLMSNSHSNTLMFSQQHNTYKIQLNNISMLLRKTRKKLQRNKRTDEMIKTLC